MKTDWAARWLARANELAKWSKDPSTQVGCILVLNQHAVAEGYNGFPHGVDDSSERLLQRATKYDWTIHAEANAVAHAARYGHSTRGVMAFVTFPPCPSCTTLLIQAGVVQLVVQLPVVEACEDCVRGNPRYPRSAFLAAHLEKVAPGFAQYHVRARIGAPPGFGSEEVLVGCRAKDTTAEWLARWAVSQVILAEAGVPVVEVTP